jgi:hypothetical protein
MSHQFITLFGRGIETYRVVAAVIDGKRDFAVVTVNAGAGSVYQMLYSKIPDPFDNVQKTIYVAAYIGIRIFYAVADSRLCGEVAHQIEFVIQKKLVDRSFIRKIELIKQTAVMRGLDPAPVGDVFPVETALVQSGELQVDIVIIVEIVDTDHLMTSRNQPFMHMVTDESGVSRYQYFHIRSY